MLRATSLLTTRFRTRGFAATEASLPARHLDLIEPAEAGSGRGEVSSLARGFATIFAPAADRSRRR